MTRRDFLQASAAVTAATAVTGSLQAQASASTEREIYELRQYHLRRGPMQKGFDDFFSQTALPALNKSGVSKVGVFDLFIGPDSPTKYVLLSYPSMNEFGASRDALRNHEGILKSEFNQATPASPAFVRVESSLFRAFKTMPKLEVPAATAAKKGRMFELRIYESHSEKAHLKKVEMFDEGEIPIFRKTGLAPVFFGEALIGSRLPNLTYMLTFENMAERDRNWGTFGGDPEWRKLSSTPGYTDPEIVTNISSVFLRPTSYSQL